MGEQHGSIYGRGDPRQRQERDKDLDEGQVATIGLLRGVTAIGTMARCRFTMECCRLRNCLVADGTAAPFHETCRTREDQIFRPVVHPGEEGCEAGLLTAGPAVLIPAGCRAIDYATTHKSGELGSRYAPMVKWHTLAEGTLPAIISLAARGASRAAGGFCPRRRLRQGPAQASPREEVQDCPG